MIKKSYKENDRVLYVIANPYDYTIYCLNKVLGWTLSHVAQAQSDFEYFEKNKPNLIEYLRDPYDAFLYKEHAEGYLNNDSRKYDLMFIKYESLKDNDIMNRVKSFGIFQILTQILNLNKEVVIGWIVVKRLKNCLIKNMAI